MDYHTAISRLYGLINYERSKGFVKDLENFRKLLKALGNPHSRLPNPILIAGTKGKGSVAYMVAKALNNSGFKVGLNTSPHLTSLHERIQVNGEAIGFDDLAFALSEVFRAVDSGCKTTFFEAITASAILHFLRKGTEYQVFEVGLGGRLDATNVVEQKVGVITRIDYDHTDVLGDTLEDIAREKAGIIKPESVIFTPSSNSRVIKTIEKAAKEVGADVIVVNHKTLEVGAEGTVFETDEKVIKLPLLGDFQAENGALAYHVLKALGLNFDPKGVFIPGRLHIISKSPIILIDGAHNAVSAYYLVSSLRKIFPAKRFNFVLAFSRGKDCVSFIKTVSEIAHWIFVLQYPYTRSLPAQEAYRACIRFHTRCKILKNIYEIMNILNEDTIITGSFYLLGYSLRYFWGSPFPV